MPPKMVDYGLFVSIYKDNRHNYITSKSIAYYFNLPIYNNSIGLSMIPIN